MTIKLLFWIALIVLVVLAVRSKVRTMSGQGQGQGQPGPGQRGALDEGEAMRCCAHCHVYFPASEAVRADGLDYCSPAHVRLPPQ